LGFDFEVLLRKMVKEKRKMAFIAIHIVNTITIAGLSSKADLFSLMVSLEQTRPSTSDCIRHV